MSIASERRVARRAPSPRVTRQVAGLVVACVVGSGGVLAAAAPAAAAADWTVPGPEGSGLSATVHLDDDGALSLSVARGGQPVLAPGGLGVRTSGHDLTQGLTFAARADAVVDESYTMVSGKRLERTATMSESTFRFTGDDGTELAVVVRVADDGVAYRYVVGPEAADGTVTVEREASTFVVDPSSPAWVQPYRAWYENEHTETTVGAANGAQPASCAGEVCSFGYPLLVRSGESYVLLSESDVDGRYAGSHLTHRAGEGTLGVELFEGDAVTAAGPLATPWRTAIVGDLATVVGSTLVDDLAPGSRLTDTSWIDPGISAWSWVSENQSPRDPERQRDYVDFAAANGFDYVLVDEGWEESWIKDLTRYARAQGVDVLLWFHHRSLLTPEQRGRWLPLIKSWGVAGVKVDFMESDGQGMYEWYDAILQDTADLELMINFHGSTIPHGTQRTWPHVMSFEAVRGAENGHGPRRNVYLSYTRNVVGSMDYTPTWLSRGQRQTSLAHELALPVVFESAWTHVADNPEGIAAVPGAGEYLAQLPTVWDETRYVAGSPQAGPDGTHQSVLARRSGDRWFLGGITAGAPGEIAAPLDFLGAGEWLADTLRDGGTRGAPGELVRSVETVTASSVLTAATSENGGLAVILCPATPGRENCLEPVVTAPRTELTVAPSTVSAGPRVVVPVRGSLAVVDDTDLADVELRVDADRLPAGWTVEGDAVTAASLGAGGTLAGAWQVRVAADVRSGAFEVPVVATYADPAEPGRRIHVEQVVTVTVPLLGEVHVSDLPFVTESNGYGPVERDQSNGEAARDDGAVISINGTTFDKGLGTHGPAHVEVDLGGRCTTFSAAVGIDDEVTNTGSSIFVVEADGRELFRSPEVRSGEGPLPVEVDVTDARRLSLRVLEASNGKNYDHADWGTALLTCADSTPPVVFAELAPAVPDGAAGWWVEPVTVDLSASGGAEGDLDLEYRVGDGEWVPYTAPFAVSREGEYEVAYRATDREGAVSSEASTAVRLDTSAPVVQTVGVGEGQTLPFGTAATLGWSATDAVSGIAAVTARFDGIAVAGTQVPLSAVTAGQHTLVVTAVDVAGRPTEHVLRFAIGAETPGAPRFTDVGVDSKFHPEIEWLAAEEISRGYPDGTFRPAHAVTRQAMASFVQAYVGAEFTPAPGTQTFVDVPADHPFHAAVEWMYAQGLTTGTRVGDELRFNPSEPVSRQAMAAFLHRLADEPTPTGGASFTDVAADHPFGAAIAWLEEAEVTRGYVGGTFGSTQPVSRQAMAAFLYRFDALG